jgi:hypothetical protein
MASFFARMRFPFVLKMEKFIASWLQSPEADEQPALQHPIPKLHNYGFQTQSQHKSIKG